METPSANGFFSVYRPRTADHDEFITRMRENTGREEGGGWESRANRSPIMAMSAKKGGGQGRENTLVQRERGPGSIWKNRGTGLPFKIIKKKRG